MAGRLHFGGCNGTTKRGTPCRCREVFANGFCKFHGGEGESPFEFRKRLTIGKMQKRLRHFIAKYSVKREE